MIIERMDRHHQNSTISSPSSKSKKAPPGNNHKELAEDMKRLVKLPMERRMAMAKESRKEQLQCYNAKDREPKVKVNDCKRTGSSRRRDCEKRVQFESSAVLFSLICEGDVEGVRNLISANKRIKNVTNHHGMTALHQSCISHNLGMIHALVKEFSVDISIPDHELWTPLHTAALLGFTDVAKFLLDNGADPLALNADRNMPYDICDGAEDTLDIIELRMVNKGVTQEKIEGLRTSKELEMLKELESAFNSDNSLMQKGDNGETLLHVAASLGYKHVAKFLLTKTSITIDDEDKDGWQAIHCAAYWNQLNVVELLVDHGACIYSTTSEDETALDLCRDETMKEWMTQKAEQDNKYVKKASCVRRDTRKASIQEHFGTSHFDSLVSLNELNKFSHSSNRLNAEMKEAKKKKDLKREYQSLVTSPADDHAYDHSAPPTPSSSPPTPTNLLSSSPPTPTISPSSAPPSWTLNPVSSPISKSAPESSSSYLKEKMEITRSHSNLNSKSSSTNNFLSTRPNSSYVSIYNSKLENYGKLDSPIIRDDPLKKFQRSPSGSFTPSPKSPNLTQTSGKQFVFPAPHENGNIVHWDDSKKQGQKERSNSKKEKSEKIPKSIQKLFHLPTKESSRATRTGSLIPKSDLTACELPRRTNSNLDVSRFVQIHPGDECDAIGHKNKTQNSSKKLKMQKKSSSKCVIS